MTENKPFSIFDQASRQLSKKKNEPLQPKQPLPPEIPQKSPIADEEVESMFQKIDAMKRELLNQMDDIKVKSGIPIEVIDQFLSDSANFPKKTWERLQSEMKELERKTWEAIGQDKKQLVKVRKEQHISKRKRAKTIGGRRNWLPMQ